MKPSRSLRRLHTTPIPPSTHRPTPFRNPRIPAATTACTTTPRFTSTTQAPPKTSVDPTEVSHFNALASSWWDPHGPSRLLHLMNPLRHTFISRCRANIASPDAAAKLRYLDIGCGGGIFAESAARLQGTASVVGIDPTPEVLRIAEAHRRRDPVLVMPGRLTYLNVAIENLSTAAAGAAGADTSSQHRKDAALPTFDIVTIFEVLEHVSTPSPFLTLAMQHVKPGGWLVLSTIARTWTSWLVTNVVAEDVLGIVPKGTHDWGKYVNEHELRSWFLERGWGRLGSDMRAMGVVYLPGLGWREVGGSEGWGNYFFGVRRPLEE